MTEAIDARFLRSMLYEPLPGSAAVILAQLGIIEPGQIDALGARTYDAESARLSLALDDGRTVELERAMHLHTENGYAVRIRSRAGQTISRSFIHIDRDLGVRNLYNDRMVYIDDSGLSSAAADPDSSEAHFEVQIEAEADQAHESQTYAFHVGFESREAEPEAAFPSIEAFPASSLEEQGLVSPPVSDSAPYAAPREASEEDLIVVEEHALESPTEMLDIFTEAHVATILYFHEPTSPEVDPAPASETPARVDPPLSVQTASSLPEAASAHEPEPIALEGDPEYAPLHVALAPAEAAAFTFIAQTGTIYTYEHRETLRYIHIDALSGLFYDQTRTPISRTAALRRALTALPAGTQSSEPATEASASLSTTSHESPLAASAFTVDPQPAPPPTAVPQDEPALRTRAIPAARAAVRPEPTSETAALQNDHGLSLDAFTRKHDPSLQRESWRSRFPGLRVFRLNRNSSNETGSGDDNS